MLDVVDWSAVAALISALIAIGALTFAVVSFRSQQKWAVRPYFWVRSDYFTNQKAVVLCNDGVGPAVIEHAEFSKNGRSEKRIVDLLDLGYHFSWDMFTGLPRGRVIPAQGEVVLLKLSLSRLVAQGIDRVGRVGDLEST